MIPRKTTHADLERKRSIFFELGIMISLGIVLFLMELNFKSVSKTEMHDSVEVIPEQEMVPITRQEQSLPPPPPKMNVAMDILKIVDDDVNIEEELEIFDSEAD